MIEIPNDSTLKDEESKNAANVHLSSTQRSVLFSVNALGLQTKLTSSFARTCFEAEEKPLSMGVIASNLPLQRLF